MDDMQQQLRATFFEEMEQFLSDCEQCFLALESSPEDSGLIDCIFRLAHNIKGSAKAVNFDDLSDFVHELESVLLKVKGKDIPISSDMVNLFLQIHDLLHEWIHKLKDCMEAPANRLTLLARLKEINAQAHAGSKPDHNNKCAPTTGWHMFQDEPVIAPSSYDKSATTNQDDAIRVKIGRVDDLVNDVGELVILQAVLKQQKHLISSPLLQNTIDQLTKITRHIQETSMRLRMVPVTQTFQKMQRILRDTSKALHKDVELHIAGENTELDKIVLDKLGDPLTHLVRNAVDHGIESSEQRRLAGKLERGNIWLSAYHHGDRIIIELKDDGAGLNAQKIKQKAIDRGLLKATDDISDEAAMQLIFLPGFSTKNEVTDISGRGVGLDVVKTNIAQLKGDVLLSSTPGQGTCFKISLPLTLAIIDGLIIRLNDRERYIIPLAQVHQIHELNPDDIHDIGRDSQVFQVRGESIPFYRLGHILGREQHSQQKRGVVIVAKFSRGECAFLAESVVSQQQIVIKQLGRDLRKIRGISGSAILGDGKAALILDLEDIAMGEAA